MTTAAPPVGKVRPTGLMIVLFVITFGIYGYVYFYAVHSELQRANGGEGIGGPVALVITFFVSPVMAFVTAHEVSQLYTRAGRRPPVSAMTGLWYVPGFLLLGIGPIVWFVKTNGALNAYWSSAA